MPSEGGSGVGVLGAFLAALLRLGGLLPSLRPLAGRLLGADASSALSLQQHNASRLQCCDISVQSCPIIACLQHNKCSKCHCCLDMMFHREPGPAQLSMDTGALT